MSRHRLDVLSLLPGIVFVVIGLAAVAEVVDVGLLVRGRWVLPVVLITLGLVVLLSVARGRPAASDPPPAAEDGPSAP